MRLTPKEAFNAALDPLFNESPEAKVGVAVSGGSDSIALLLLAHEWAKSLAFKISAVTVDHGLRPEVKDEIAYVAQVCRDLNIPHDVLNWTDWSGIGNLQASARSARYELLDDWVLENDIDVVLLGHTADDQVETFLMRLARGSGVDGLAGMAQAQNDYFRPLLGVGREDLRVFLRERKVPWCDDPSNEDDRFDRVKARKMKDQLADLGLTQDRILRTAQHMENARLSLEQAAFEFAKAHVKGEEGDLLIPAHTFHKASGDTAVRIISGAVCWVGGTIYKPRYESLLDAAGRVARGETRTLQGVIMKREADVVRVSREVSAAKSAADVILQADAPQGEVVWDNKWCISVSNPTRNVISNRQPNIGQVIVKVLGERIKDVPDWRDVGLPRASLMASPAVFEGETLISAPVAGYNNGFEARIVTDFLSFLLSR